MKPYPPHVIAALHGVRAAFAFTADPRYPGVASITEEAIACITSLVAEVRRLGGDIGPDPREIINPYEETPANAP